MRTAIAYYCSQRFVISVAIQLGKALNWCPNACKNDICTPHYGFSYFFFFFLVVHINLSVQIRQGDKDGLLLERELIYLIIS